MEWLLHFDNAARLAHLVCQMAKSAASPAPAPRAPSQDRGLQRVEQILDAAESLVAELGVEGTSTNAIAERAKTSMGSLYHFFPSKEALIEALARRFAERKRELNAKAVPVDGARMPLEEVVDALVGQVRDFLAARLPAMREQERNTAATLSVATVHGVLLTAMRLPPRARGPLLRELKRMLVAYVAPLDVRYGATHGRTGARRRDA